MTKDRKTVLLLGDIVMLVASFIAMVAIRFDVVSEGVFIAAQARMFVLLYVIWLIVFFIFDLYNLRRVNPNPRNIGLLALAIISSTLVSVLVFYISAYKGITPKTNLVIVALFSFILLVIWRRFFYNIFSLRFVQRIGVIGYGPAVDHLLEDLAKQPYIGKVVSIQKTYTDTVSIPPIDILIAHEVNLEGLFWVSQEKECEIFSLFEAYEELIGKIPVGLMSEEKAIEALTRRNQRIYRALERVIEIVFALLVLLISFPFLLLAAICILVEDGKPIYITQQRVGKNSKIFNLYKLRSMKALAPDGSAEQEGVQWAGKNDSRITKVGKILRATHIDEILQMINVLKGDIAFVGPRPERPEFVTTLEQKIPFYFLRHTIKPGFTGWAQIKFRYARSLLDSREKFEYDLYYLLNKNPLFDLGIFIKTVQIIFTH